MQIIDPRERRAFRKTLKAVRRKLKKALRLPPGVGEPRVIDLLWHTPAGVIDRRATPTVPSHDERGDGKRCEDDARRASGAS